MDAGSSSSLQLPRQFQQFTISEIHSATENFDESLVIGHGGFGKVYKGTISDLVVAIKRLDSTSNQGAAEFWAEVHMLSELRHCHLVSLIGYCNHGEEMILVYEYMSRGTLEDHLHKFHSPLPWVRRLKICLGAARGLDYLHTGVDIKHGVIHRDVKSSNILLDDSWAAKISDFGLSKLGPINQLSSYVNTFVKGTFGYFDPEYFATGKLTRKSDVYAFGVVLFEVLSGKRAVDQSIHEEHWGLVRWAQESIKEGRLKQIVDHNIRERILPKCLKEFARLADRCLHSNPKRRPTMAEIVICLGSVLALQEKASNTLLHPRGMTRLGNRFLSAIWGRRLPFWEFDFATIGGEDKILRRFEFGTINSATENFSKNNRISVLPSMYKGRLQNGQRVSIAIYESTSYNQEYKDEVSLLVQLEHQNLLQLVGYSIEGTQVILVYESAISASLDHLIDVPLRTLLDWNKRKKIILGVARALLYLHQYDVIHSNVTPENILLDESLDPKLSNLGHVRLIPTDCADHIQVDTILGTLRYMAPEYATKGHLSTKADVFSFGILILETISECRNYNHREDMTLLQYVWTTWLEGRSSNIIDPTIHANSSSITRFIHIWLLCTQENPADRPTMEEVVGMLTNSSSVALPIPKYPMSSWMMKAESESLIAQTHDYDSGAVEEFISELCPR